MIFVKGDNMFCYDFVYRIEDYYSVWGLQFIWFKVQSVEKLLLQCMVSCLYDKTL